MKKIGLLTLAAALFVLASCNPKPVEPVIPDSIEVELANLSKGDIVSGTVNTLPVTAEGSGTVINLSFFTDKIYLTSGTYGYGQDAGKFTGHYKDEQLDLDIKSGSVVVTLDGDEDYSINGTVRLDNEIETLVQFKVKGKMMYEFPTEFYYTYEANAKVGNLTANVYKIFDMNTSVQLAEVAVCGKEEGEFDIASTGAAGTAVYGGAVGCWFWEEEDGYGRYPLFHGKVTVNKSHGKLNFVLNDLHSATFNNCELKDVKPVLRTGTDSFEGLTAKFYVVESPVISGRSEITTKIYYADGREFLCATAVATTTNPMVEKIGKRINFSIVDGYDKMAEEGLYCLYNSVYYTIDGVYYGAGDATVVQFVYKDKNGKQSIAIVPIVYDGVDTVNISMPEPLYSYVWPDEETRSVSSAMYVTVGVSPNYTPAQ